MNRTAASVQKSGSATNAGKTRCVHPRSSVSLASSNRSSLVAEAASFATLAKPLIQPKLRIGASDDKYEQEADRVADQVMRMPEPGSLQVQTSPRQIQRLCTVCEDELRHQPKAGQVKDEMVQRKPDSARIPQLSTDTAAQIQSLKGGGHALDSSTLSFMESRFGRDFSQVRIHADNRAADLANNINARAFTIGGDVVFASGQYRQHGCEGQRLIAHELTHVVQQGYSRAKPRVNHPTVAGNKRIQATGAGRGSSTVIRDGHVHSITPHASAAKNTIFRADTDAVGRTMALGITTGTGIQFFPTNVTDTRVGPVSIAGGLRHQRANRLNVIIGEHLTPRLLARLILPLWTTATPFTAPGTAAPVPLDNINEEILARGLMAYNRDYLGLPNMNKWRAGLRFPLPVLIDEATGVATLHPGLILRLSTGFEAAWLPLLDSPSTAVAAVPAATLATDVRDFLARETTASARGIHLSARAKTNAVAELPFIRETFRQLGAAGFDVALEFMNWMVNRGISLLAAQRDGAAILGEVQTALAAAPAVLTAGQQSSLDRANLMLGLVAGVAVQAPPAARRTRPEKTVVVDTLKLVGSTHNPATQISIANGIFSQCNVRIQHGVNADDNRAAAPFTTTWLGGDTDLRSSNSCGSLTADQRRLFQGGTAQYGMGAGDISAYFVATATGLAGGGYTCSTAPGTHALFRRKSVVKNSGSADTLAHELGHQLIRFNNLERHTLPGIMHGRPRATVTLSTAQCNRIYNNA
jgi:hypothetical protein